MPKDRFFRKVPVLTFCWLSTGVRFLMQLRCSQSAFSLLAFAVPQRGAMPTCGFEPRQAAMLPGFLFGWLWAPPCAPLQVQCEFGADRCTGLESRPPLSLEPRPWASICAAGSGLCWAGWEWPSPLLGWIRPLLLVQRGVGSGLKGGCLVIESSSHT